MITTWTKHLHTEEDKKQFEDSLRGSKHILNRLSDILTNMEASLNNSELSAENYNSPNWHFKQAHVNGQKSMLRSIKFLLNLDRKEQTTNG